MVWVWDSRGWCVYFHFENRLASDWSLDRGWTRRLHATPCDVMLFAESSGRAGVAAIEANWRPTGGRR